ncbi:LPS-assembly lipoprotein LptE [Cysteiniphilum halobium]|uniref:LPS-assembly lipoprotein LptE n=1 Tax=Cysteiniphilum halobium TaxID=2219059 RepID=UPI000E64D95B|nr:LPS assembly lipoprotein LptE [Cysteiniphilum halobium]
MHYLRLRNFNFKLLLIALFVSLLYGCGFHLRGWNEGMPKFMQKVYINYNGSDFSFINALNSVITSTGAEVVPSAKDANIIIHIKSAAQSSRLVGITGGASSNDYIMSYAVTYDILNNKNKIILKDQNNSAQQTYTTNATQQLSNNTQQQQIYNNLQSQVASNIIVQMQSITLEKYNASSSEKPEEHLSSTNNTIQVAKK